MPLNRKTKREEVVKGTIGREVSRKGKGIFFSFEGERLVYWLWGLVYHMR